MMNEAPREAARVIAETLLSIQRLAPAGCSVALHHRLQAPLYLVSTFPRAWSQAYAERRLVLDDPAFAWALTRTGRISWGDLSDQDRAGVQALARANGMRHGLTIAVARGGTRSMAHLTRGDREPTGAEGDEAEAALAALHDATHPEADLHPGQREALRRLSMAFSVP